MLHALFSFQGRLNRGPYWGYSILMIALAMLALLILLWPALKQVGTVSDAQFEGLIEQAAFWPVIIITVLTLWPSLALMAKRFQDHGKSGMLAFPMMVPGVAWTATDLISKDSVASKVAIGAWLIAVIISFVYLGCMRGTVGPNQFGPDPLDRASDMMPGAPASA